MLKRIIAKIVMRGDLVVNSYKFHEYLPVGKLNPTLKRLEDWEIDEIVILQTQHSIDPIADFQRLKKSTGGLKLMTPLAYGGGINSLNQAREIVKLGADRVVISSCSDNFLQLIEKVGELLGDQSIILHIPISTKTKPGVKSIKLEDLQNLILNLNAGWGGELLITDIESDGSMNYNQTLFEDVNQKLIGRNFSYFGGVTINSDIDKFLGVENLAGICLGNNLHRTENTVFQFRNKMYGEYRKDTLNLAHLI
jgi:cyclase